MRYLLIIQIILFISCSLQPEDCNGVLGGTAEIDDCGGCIGGDTGKEACEDLDQDKFEFILINVKEKEHEVGPFIKNKGFTLPVLIDKYAVCFESFSGQTLPLTVVIDKKGIITYYHVGYKDGDEKKLAEHLKSL